MIAPRISPTTIVRMDGQNVHIAIIPGPTGFAVGSIASQMKSGPLPRAKTIAPMTKSRSVSAARMREDVVLMTSEH